MQINVRIFLAMAESIHNILTEQVSVWGKVTDRYFNNKNFFPKNLNTKYPEMEKYVKFAFDKLNNPESFREFLIELLIQTRNIHTPAAPTREELLQTLTQQLEQRGFIIKPSALLEPIVFYQNLRVGIIHLETAPHLSRNGHGLDTHLVQMAYMAESLTTILAKEYFLNFTNTWVPNTGCGAIFSIASAPIT